MRTLKQLSAGLFLLLLVAGGAQAQFVSNTLTGTAGTDLSAVNGTVGGPWAAVLNNKNVAQTPINVSTDGSYSNNSEDVVYVASAALPTTQYTIDVDLIFETTAISGEQAGPTIYVGGNGKAYRVVFYHDNSGSFDGWYLQRLGGGGVTDVKLFTVLTARPTGTHHIKWTITPSTGTFSVLLDGATLGTTQTDATYAPIQVGITQTGAMTSSSGIHLANFVASGGAVTAAPTVAPWGGYYSGSKTTTLSTTTSGASIYYTTNGTTPTSASTLYSAPISVPNTVTLKAVAIAAGTSSTVSSAVFNPAQVTPGTVLNGVLVGAPVLATSGGIYCFNGTYYWYGEDRRAATGAGQQDALPILCYSSPDLLNWTPVGDVFANPTGVFSNFVLERAKVIYNAANNNYVMWMHYDNLAYSLGDVIVATAPAPTGPFVQVGSPFQPDGHDSRDMTIYQDPGGSDYIVYATSSNNAVYSTRLTANDQGCVAGSSVNTGIGVHEGIALCKVGATYYLMASGVTGWTANENDYWTASSVQGTWTLVGNPFQPFAGGNPDYTKAYNGQTAQIIPIGGGYVWYGERYASQGNNSTTHLLLPMTIGGGTISISWVTPWALTALALAAAPASNTAGVSLSWPAVLGAQSYNLYRDGTLLLGGITSMVSPVTATDTPAAGTSHAYTVKSFAPNGESTGGTPVTVGGAGSAVRIKRLQ